MNFNIVTTNSKIIFGHTFEAKDPVTKLTRTFMVPAYERPRDRSKYMPHQGAREKQRRLIPYYHVSALGGTNGAQ